MNYIEYMKSGTAGGGIQDSTEYVQHIPLETYGPESSLTLKRNNWFKAIRDAVVQFKNNNAKYSPVVTNGTQSNNDNSLFTVDNTGKIHPARIASSSAGIAGLVLYDFINNQSRP